MPLHLNSMADLTEEQSIDLFTYVVGPAFEACNSAFATEDKLHLIGRTEMVDKNSGKVIGHFVYTIWTNLEEKCGREVDNGFDQNPHKHYIFKASAHGYIKTHPHREDAFFSIYVLSDKSVKYPFGTVH